VIPTWQGFNKHTGKIICYEGSGFLKINLFFWRFPMKLVQIVSIAALMSMSAASSAWWGNGYDNNSGYGNGSGYGDGYQRPW
jgi:hypothetical protein